MQKILFLSEHEASELHNSNTESLDHLPFFPKNSWSGGIQDLFHKSKIGDTDTFKFVIFAFGNNMSPYLLLNFLFIKYRKSPGKIPKRILKIQWTFHSIPEKKHLQYYFDVTQSNISLKPLVHINISRPLPLFLFLQEPSTITKEISEVNTNEDIDDMDLCDFIHDTSPTPAPLIEKEFEKEWETV